MANLPESCLGCKGCCTNMGVNIFDNEDILFPVEMTEVIYLRTDLYPPLGRRVRIMKHKENKECIALDSDTGHCSVYEYRPRVCKDFERGSQECLDSLGRL